MRKILNGVEVDYYLRPEYDFRHRMDSVTSEVLRAIEERDDALFHMTRDQYRDFVRECNAMTSSHDQWEELSDIINDGTRFEIYG